MNYWLLGILIVILSTLAFIINRKTGNDLQETKFTEEPVEYWAIDEDAEELNPIKCRLYLLVKKKTHERVSILWNKKALDLTDNDLLLKAKESYTGRYKGNTVQVKKYELMKNTRREDLNEGERERAMDPPKWMTDSVIPSFELSELQKKKIWNPRD